MWFGVMPKEEGFPFLFPLSSDESWDVRVVSWTVGTSVTLYRKEAENRMEEPRFLTPSQSRAAH